MTNVKQGRSILWVLLSTFYIMSPVVFAKQPPVDTTMKDVKQEMRETARAIKNYSIDQREEAVMQIKSTLNNLDEKIERLQDRLERKTGEMSDSARQKEKATLKALRKERNKVAEWVGSMQHASVEAWQEIKSGFLKSYKILQESFEQAQQEFQPQIR